jgi:hypothetical protein
MSSEPVRVLSWNRTRQYKRGILVRMVLVLLLIAVVQWLLDRRDIVYELFSVLVLGILWLLARRWMSKLHAAADEVVDYGDHLRVITARTEMMVPFSNISRAEVSKELGTLSGVTVHLVEPIGKSSRVIFLTETKSGTDYTEAVKLADELNGRAAEASSA